MFIPLVERKSQNYSEEPMNQNQKGNETACQKYALFSCFVGLCWGVFVKKTIAINCDLQLKQKLVHNTAILKEIQYF